MSKDKVPHTPTEEQQMVTLGVVNLFNSRNQKGIVRLRVSKQPPGWDDVVYGSWSVKAEVYLDTRRDPFMNSEEAHQINLKDSFKIAMNGIAKEFGYTAHCNNTWSTWWFTPKGKK